MLQNPYENIVTIVHQDTVSGFDIHILNAVRLGDILHGLMFVTLKVLNSVTVQIPSLLQAKIHEKSPLAMDFCLQPPRFLKVFAAKCKYLSELLLNSYKY